MKDLPPNSVSRLERDVPKRRPVKPMRANDGGGSSFVWQDAAVVVLIVVAIVVWQLRDEVSGVVSQKSIVGESPIESPPVGRSISSAETSVETKRQDDIGDKALARPSKLSVKLAFPPGVSSSKPTSLTADWATVDLLTEEVLPAGVTIENRFLKNGHIEVSGYADSKQAVAEYLRAIQAEGGRPKVHSVTTEQRNQRSVSAFAITIASQDS